jgi:asparagine synthase (glutamine-hydrolysing)
MSPLSGHFFISSECKTLREEEINHKYYIQSSTKVFPPGHSMYFHPEMECEIKPIRYYYPKWETNTLNLVPTVDMDLLKATLREKLISAVDKRLMAEVPFGVLLSGGLDSSLIASITSRLMKDRGLGPIHTFSIGLDGSPDLIFAKKVADFLGSIHHEYHFTPEEGIENLQALIYHLETYDVTTVRASLPMYLLSERIHKEGFKMVLSGEGADEVLGGYLYFHQAPNILEFHKECKRRINQLHEFDCLRANKSTMAHSIEARVPFLDQDFLDFTMMIHPNWKCYDKKEKWILRSAFDTKDNPYLPDEILWRQKEQFSDGVGYNWIDSLKKYTTNHPFTQQIEEKSREKEFYKYLFHEEFSKHFNEDEVVSHWVPRTDWANVGEDPSGRAQIIHEQTTLTTQSRKIMTSII